jgi:RimJ/RimL family protein N-acetyltransferase
MFTKLPRSLNRLCLRALRPDDIDAFYAYRSDPLVARYQGWEPMTILEAAEYLRSQTRQDGHVPGTWRQLGVADRNTDLLIGDMGIWLSPDGTQAEFGISIASTAQGKGYGTECVRGLLDLLFSATGITEVVANTDSRNHACRALLKRSGMRSIAVRQAEYKGESCIEFIFSAHKTDY